MRTTLTTLLATLALTGAALAAEDPSGHLGHVAQMGLGEPVENAAVPAGIPNATPAALPTEKSHRRHKPPADAARKAAVRAGYKPVTELTNGAFPPFYPGLGAVYVRPKTLPVGPFLTFDHQGRQVSTVYMLSLEEMNAHKKFEATGTRSPRVDHVTVYHHGGHPGVDFPHYHYVLWHVSKKAEARVAK